MPRKATKTVPLELWPAPMRVAWKGIPVDRWKPSYRWRLQTAVGRWLRYLVEEGYSLDDPPEPDLARRYRDYLGEHHKARRESDLFETLFYGGTRSLAGARLGMAAQGMARGAASCCSENQTEPFPPPNRRAARGLAGGPSTSLAGGRHGNHCRRRLVGRHPHRLLGTFYPREGRPGVWFLSRHGASGWPLGRGDHRGAAEVRRRSP